MEAGSRLSLKWRPRDENAEADDLTNGRYNKFDSRQRIAVKLADVDLLLLQQLWSCREDFLDKQSWIFYNGDGGKPFEKTPWGE